MIIKDMGDRYEVLLNHVVTIGKEHPLENFKQYLQDIYLEFDKDITRTLYSMLDTTNLANIHFNEQKNK
jgi:hypothetical protein